MTSIDLSEIIAEACIEALTLPQGVYRNIAPSSSASPAPVCDDRTRMRMYTQTQENCNMDTSSEKELHDQVIADAVAEALNVMG